MCKPSLNVVPKVYNRLQSSFLSLAWPWSGRSLLKGNQWECKGPVQSGSQSTWCPLTSCSPLMPLHPHQPPNAPDTPTPPAGLWCPYTSANPQCTPDASTPPANPLTFPTPLQVPLIPPDTPYTQAGPWCPLSLLYPCQLPTPLTPPTPLLTPQCPLPAPNTYTPEQESICQEWYYCTWAWHLMNLWVWLLFCQITPQPSHPSMPPRRSTSWPRVICNRPSCLLLLSVCNWPFSQIHPVYNIPSLVVKSTSSVLWSSANFCNISQNIHSKAPVALQHWKTNKVVWTRKDDWPCHCHQPPNAPDTPTPPAGLWCPYTSANPQSTPDASTPPANPLTFPTPLQVPLIPPDTPYTHAGPWCPLSLLYPCQLPTPLTPPTPLLTPQCPLPAPNTYTPEQESICQEWYYCTWAWHLMNLWVWLLFCQITPQPSHPSMPPRRSTSWPRVICNRPSCLLLLSVCNWPFSQIHPVYNIPSLVVKSTSSVLWSSANFCNISQNIHSKAPVALQHWKTNKVVWTRKVWLTPWRTQSDWSGLRCTPW